MRLPGTWVETVENHKLELARELVRQAFDFDKSGRLDPAESAAAQIIVYGQSLGGSATLRLCRWLNEQGIRVRLAVVIDAHGRDPYTVPPNVAMAANLYQRDFGPVRGAPKIVAEDPRQTRIHGNWRYSYKGQDVAMPGELFLRRWFMGSHLKMEYDPEPWRRVRDLLVSAVNNSGADAICSLPRWVAKTRSDPRKAGDLVLLSGEVNGAIRGRRPVELRSPPCTITFWKKPPPRVSSLGPRRFVEDGQSGQGSIGQGTASGLSKQADSASNVADV
jgi:pimeloyl-ACP methyl ester carboxylesterase